MLGDRAARQRAADGPGRVRLPGVRPVFVAIIAGIVTLGVLDAYLGPSPSSARRSAATGTCPGGSPGARSRRRARRALPARRAVTVYFALALATDLDLAAFMLVHTSCMVAIYAVGMVAAVRLLDRWSFGWWPAVVAPSCRSGCGARGVAPDRAARARSPRRGHGGRRLLGGRATLRRQSGKCAAPVGDEDVALEEQPA